MDRERREETELWLRLQQKSERLSNFIRALDSDSLKERVTLYRLKNIDGSRVTTIIPPTDEETIHASWDIDKADLKALGKEIGEYFESDFTIDWRTE